MSAKKHSSSFATKPIAGNDSKRLLQTKSTSVRESKRTKSKVVAQSQAIGKGIIGASQKNVKAPYPPKMQKKNDPNISRIG